MVKSRAAIMVEFNKPLVVDEVEFDDPGPEEVLVRNFASGVCHSQLHQIHGILGGPLPSLLGHEATGEIVAVGGQVKDVAPGDKVIVNWLPRDVTLDSVIPPRVGHARWHGEPITHEGAGITTWSEYTLSSHQYVVKVPQSTPNDVSSIIGCAVMTGAGAVINSADVQQGESAAVFGVGGVGLCAIAALAARKADPIIAVDLSDEKLAFARKFGANTVINASSEDPVAKIQAITGGGADYAFDAIGREVTQRQIVEAIRPGRWGVSRGGTAAIIGGGKGEAMIPIRNLLQGEKHFIGTLGGTCRPTRDFPIFLDWYKSGMLPLDDLVTERHPLDDINLAIERLEQGKVLGRSIIEF